MKNTKDLIKAKTDYGLCKEYQMATKCADLVYANQIVAEMIERYHLAIEKNTNYVMERVPINRLGYDRDDVKQEVMMRVPKAMAYVDGDRITDIDRFSFAYILNKWAGQLTHWMWEQIKAQKRKAMSDSVSLKFTAKDDRKPKTLFPKLPLAVHCEKYDLVFVF